MSNLRNTSTSLSLYSAATLSSLHYVYLGLLWWDLILLVCKSINADKTFKTPRQQNCICICRYVKRSLHVRATVYHRRHISPIITRTSPSKLHNMEPIKTLTIIHAHNTRTQRTTKPSLESPWITYYLSPLPLAKICAVSVRKVEEQKIPYRNTWREKKKSVLFILFWGQKLNTTSCMIFV